MEQDKYTELLRQVLTGEIDASSPEVQEAARDDLRFAELVTSAMDTQQRLFDHARQTGQILSEALSEEAEPADDQLVEFVHARLQRASPASQAPSSLWSSPVTRIVFGLLAASVLVWIGSSIGSHAPATDPDEPMETLGPEFEIELGPDPIVGERPNRVLFRWSGPNGGSYTLWVEANGADRAESFFVGEETSIEVPAVQLPERFVWWVSWQQHPAPNAPADSESRRSGSVQRP